MNLDEFGFLFLPMLFLTSFVYWIQIRVCYLSFSASLVNCYYIRGLYFLVEEEEFVSFRYQILEKRTLCFIYLIYSCFRSLLYETVLSLFCFLGNLFC